MKRVKKVPVFEGFAGLGDIEAPYYPIDQDGRLKIFICKLQQYATYRNHPIILENGGRPQLRFLVRKTTYTNMGVNAKIFCPLNFLGHVLFGLTKAENDTAMVAKLLDLTKEEEYIIRNWSDGY